VVVTRYFGGVKLGKGGLVRAYSGAVQHALREARTAERVETRALRIDIPYAHVDAVRRALEQHGATIDDETFEGAVTLCVRVGEDRVDALTQALADATAGAARIQPAE
jgi:putative IMPACT (imprinted ancient) family translation regulator